MILNLKKLSLATSITIYYVTSVTIIGELYKPLKNALAAVGGHHWVGKGITAFIVYLLAYGLLSFINNKSQTNNISRSIFISPLISTLVLLIFFVYEYSL